MRLYVCAGHPTYGLTYMPPSAACGGCRLHLYVAELERPLLIYDRGMLQVSGVSVSSLSCFV